MGQYLRNHSSRKYDVLIPEETACIRSSNDPSVNSFRAQSGVVLPEILWDDNRCTTCTPACDEDAVCDYNGGGFCICPNSNQVGPNCDSKADVYFASDHVFETFARAGESRVEEIRFPVQRTRSDTQTLLHAVDLFSDDKSVDPFMSEVVWNNDTSGIMKVRVPVTTQEEIIHIGMKVSSKITYPDARVTAHSNVTVKIHPFGGFVEFDKPSVTLNENVESNTACPFRVKRTEASGGNISVMVRFVRPSEVNGDNVCFWNNQDENLDLDLDLEITSDSFTLFWTDQDTSTRCVGFAVKDDDVVENRETMCLEILPLYGNIEIRQGHALVVVEDNDELIKSDYTVTIIVGSITFLSASLFLWYVSLIENHSNTSLKHLNSNTKPTQVLPKTTYDPKISSYKTGSSLLQRCGSISKNS